MTQTQHTPGPWHHKYPNAINPQHEIGYDEENVKSTVSGCIAHVNGTGGGGEIEANADLIAAAPELLEALVECKEAIGDYCHGEITQSQLAEKSLAAQNAIAKARGQA